MVLRILEVWITARLLASPIFHRVVRRAHKKVHEIKRGEKLYDTSEGGGTNIEIPGADNAKKFVKHFLEEVKDQFRGSTKR